MISLLAFLTILLGSKDTMVFSSFFLLDYSSILLISIIPLVYYSIMSMNFSSISVMNKKINQFYWSVIFLSLSFCFLSSSMFLFLLFMELSILPTCILIFELSKGFEKIKSVIFMVFTNLSGSLPFMFFVAYTELENFSFLHIYNTFKIDSLMIFIFFVFMMLCKLPMFTVHFWLTKAHVSASGGCSMILASLLLKLGTFGLYKFSSSFSSMKFNKLFSLILVISILGCVIIVGAMTRFFDIKLLVALSSVFHMSSIFPLLFLNSNFSSLISMFMMVGHGVISCYLFYLITLMYEGCLNRSSDFNKSLESVSKILSMFVFIFVLMNIGVPPFISFLSEMFLCCVLSNLTVSMLLLFCLIMTSLVLFNMFILSNFIFFKKNSFISSKIFTSFCLDFLYFFFVMILLVYL